MSAKSNPTDELEELSRLLDEMNIGHQPICNNKETAELLAIAALLKETGGQVNPPQHLLTQTVDRALTGIHSGKSKKFKTWLFSGALGTAASVILVLGLNLLPSWQQQVPVVPPLPAASQQQYTSQPKPKTEQPPTVSQAAPSELPKLADTIAAAVKQAPASEPELQKQPLPAAPVPPAEVSKPQNTVKKSLILAEEMPRLGHSKSAYTPADSFLPEYSSPSPALTPLSLPNKTPDLIVADRENGILRQVYCKGTPQEITITQRLRPTETGTVQSKFQVPVIMEAVEDKTSLINQIKVILFDQEITIEGRQSKQKLKQIAESLTP